MTLFKHFKLLPDEVAKQDPRLLFFAIDGIEDEETGEIPDKWKFFYGM